VLAACLQIVVPVAAQTGPPVIASVSGPAARSGYVEILGNGFGTEGTVLADGLPCITATWTDTRIVAYVPDLVKPGFTFDRTNSVLSQTIAWF
jgi:hypothetical protein